MTIETQIVRNGAQLVVTLTGRMTFRDYASADEMLTAIFVQVDAVVSPRLQALVFNLAAVTMIDSHWLGMFVRAQRQAEAAGLPIILKGAQPSVRRLFDLVQFNRVFRIED